MTNNETSNHWSSVTEEEWRKDLSENIRDTSRFERLAFAFSEIGECHHDVGQRRLARTKSNYYQTTATESRTLTDLILATGVALGYRDDEDAGEEEER